jgi:rRNA maturation endonuclease Nob1
MMKECYNCGRWWDEYFNYCPICGYALEQRQEEEL